MGSPQHRHAIDEGDVACIIPDDEQCKKIGDQYLWGRDMLIAPVYEKGAVPVATFIFQKVIGMIGGQIQKTTGGKTITRNVDLSVMPIYVRAGAIIPIDPVRQYTSEKVNEPTTLKIFSGANGQLYII